MIVQVNCESKRRADLEPLFSQSLNETLDAYFPGECEGAQADIKIEGSGRGARAYMCKLLVRVSASAIFVVNHPGESVRDAFNKASRKLRDLLSRRRLVTNSGTESFSILRDGRPVFGQKFFGAHQQPQHPSSTCESGLFSLNPGLTPI